MHKITGWNGCVLGVVLAVAWASGHFALAGNPQPAKSAAGCCGPRWCCDDYCPKPCPKVCLPSYCGGCDSYCPVPTPCIKLPSYCGKCDTYCPKPEPCVKLPCKFPSFYRCPPKSCGDWKNSLPMLPKVSDSEAPTAAP